MARPLHTTLTRHAAEIALAAAVVSIAALMIVPLPTWLLDVLIATNLCLSLLLLTTALLVGRALSFASFPTILLVTTLFRLALNVSSTRLILLQADAGEVIRAFGDFVVRGDYVVGAVVFLILTIIQLVVVARGSERVAEVGARFTLDAMPGKQLAIDSDLRAGLLDAEGAAARRRELEREGQFYGAMDGAMKFVKGDAIAAIVVTLVNIVGGLTIGVLSHDMGLVDALEVYGLLTIGDGLVSQIPALLISTAAGFVVTRVASADESGTLGGDIGKQIFGDWRALGVSAAFAALLAFVPGLPFVPFAILAALLGVVATATWRRRPALPALDGDTSAPLGGPLEVRVGTSLARRLAADHVFTERLRDGARELYERRGTRLPVVAPRPTPALHGHAYELRLGAVAVDRGRCPEDASASDHLVRAIVASATAHAEQLLGLQEVQRELDALARGAPALVRAVVPERLTLARLAGLLRGLAAERVHVGALREILEAAALDPLPTDDSALVETIRARLARPLTHGLLDQDGVLRVRALDPALEDAMRDAMGDDGTPILDPDLARDVVVAVRAAMGADDSAVLLTQPDVRAPLRRLLAPELPNVTILSYREIDPSVQVEQLGMVSP